MPSYLSITRSRGTIRRAALLLLAAAASTLILGSQCTTSGEGLDDGGDGDGTTTPNTQVTIETTQGTIVIEVMSAQAPDVVANFLKYADEDHYYDNTIVQELLSGGTGFFVGDFTADLVENEQKLLANESNNGLANTRGRVALYGPEDVDFGRPTLLFNVAANTQFDYVLSAEDNRVDFTVIGQVVEGLDVLDKIATLSTTSATSEGGTNLSAIPVTDSGNKVRILTIRSEAVEPDNNEAPVADAGPDQTVEPDTTVTLDASGSSDPDADDTLTYKWKLSVDSQQALLDAELEIVLNDTTAEKPTFTAPAPDAPLDVTFELTVTDDWGEQDTDEVTITLGDHTSPSARAGADQTDAPGETISFDASQSTAADSGDLTYAWELTEASRQLLEDQGATVPGAGTDVEYSFVAPEVTVPTVLTFQLTVTDADAAIGEDTVQARILPVGFGAPTSYATYPTAGAAPTALAVADFDGDSIPDLTVCNSAKNRVSVLTNDGTGVFGTPVSYNLGGSPKSLVAADFDGDGDQDIVAIIPATNTLRVLENDGAGGFTIQPDTFTLGSGATSPLAVDLDSKNNADVVALNLDTSNVSVLLNDGDGAFSFPNIGVNVISKDSDENVIATTGPRLIAAGAINTEAPQDLLVVFKDTHNAAAWLGDGRGDFTSGNTFQVGDGVATPRDMLLTDLDADSRADSAIALDTLNTIAVRRGSSAGSFGIEGRFATGANPSSLIAAEVNGDTHPDLVVANEDDDNISYLQNKGSAAFKARVNLALAAGDTTPVDLGGGDFDNNGTTDLVVLNKDSATVTILLNQTSAVYAPVDAAGFTTTKTWLKYKDITVGTGEEVTESSTVVARYTGRLNDENGEIFDTTVGTDDEESGREFSLGSVVAGWKEGLGNYDMKVGGTRQLIIPGDLGYGAEGSGEKIPPNATLWFEVEVLEIK